MKGERNRPVIKITRQQLAAGLAPLAEDTGRFGTISPSDVYLVREILEAVLSDQFVLQYSSRSDVGT